MQELGTREGNPQFSATTRVTRGDTIRFHAISRNGRSETAVPISYNYLTGSESSDYPVFAIIPRVITLPGCTCSPACPENDGLAENKSVSASDFNKTEV